MHSYFLFWWTVRYSPAGMYVNAESSMKPMAHFRYVAWSLKLMKCKSKRWCYDFIAEFTPVTSTVLADLVNVKTVCRLIDCFGVEAAVTSLSMSATGDFLATSHVDDLGVYIWSNNTLYSFVPLPPLPEGFEHNTIQMPATAFVPSGQESIAHHWLQTVNIIL